MLLMLKFAMFKIRAAKVQNSMKTGHNYKFKLK
jgi:hypothetical protein